jgi:pimeloyl-ACP methyl ester carboxylesterase
MSTWVLMRGLTRESAHWGDFPARLAAAMPDARIVLVDLPGAGVLRQQRCPLSVAAMVDACREQLRAAQVAGPCHLLGLSMGGMVATAWAMAHPAEVAACVLVNTSMRPFSPPQQRLRWQLLPQLLGLLTTRDGQRIERTILRLTSAHHERHADVVGAWCSIRASRPVTAINAARQLLAAARFRGPQRAPAMPVLVVCSAGDGLVDPACSQRIAAAWQRGLRQHPDAGHDLPLDAGDWLADCIAQWRPAPPDRSDHTTPRTPR